MADDLAGDWWAADPSLNAVAEESNDEEASLQPGASSGKPPKRKADAPPGDGLAAVTTSKKKKKQKKKNSNGGQPREYVRHQEAARLIGSGAAGCAEYIRSILQKDGKMADLEMDELDLESSKFSTSEFFERTGEASRLGDFVKEVVIGGPSRLAVKRMKTNASPRVLVIASGAIRCTHIIKGLHSIADGSPVAKLFAKHMKLQEQASFLSSKKFLFAVGTPNRILKLLEADGLSLQQTRLVVLDSTWKDAKSRNIFDVPEIRGDIITLLSQHFLLPSDEKLEVALY